MTTATPSVDRVPPPRVREGWLFLAEAISGFRATGAIAPSSRRLAQVLAAPLRTRAGHPLDVLKVGAGTGAVTRTLIPLLGANSRLDIVEANARFAARLRQEVQTPSSRAGARGRVRVHHQRIEQLNTGDRYDVIVSGLPVTNFSPHQAEAIMGRYVQLLRPGGTLVYFTYLGAARARGLLASRREADRHRAVDDVLARYHRRFAADRQTVWANLPPARVWCLHTPTTVATTDMSSAPVRAANAIPAPGFDRSARSPLSITAASSTPPHRDSAAR